MISRGLRSWVNIMKSIGPMPEPWMIDRLMASCVERWKPSLVACIRSVRKDMIQLMMKAGTYVRVLHGRPYQNHIKMYLLSALFQGTTCYSVVSATLLKQYWSLKHSSSGFSGQTHCRLWVAMAADERIAIHRCHVTTLCVFFFSRIVFASYMFYASLLYTSTLLQRSSVWLALWTIATYCQQRHGDSN